jgi:hypothetical protein
LCYLFYTYIRENENRAIIVILLQCSLQNKIIKQLCSRWRDLAAVVQLSWKVECRRWKATRQSIISRCGSESEMWMCSWIGDASSCRGATLGCQAEKMEEIDSGESGGCQAEEIQPRLDSGGCGVAEVNGGEGAAEVRRRRQRGTELANRHVQMRESLEMHCFVFFSWSWPNVISSGGAVSCK